MAGERELHGKVALVTGAGSGIGKAAALAMGRAGARVGVISRTAEEIERTAEEIRAVGGEALAITADTADTEAMRAAFDRLIGEYGRLDILFANAGINGVWAPIDEIQPEEWDKTIAINLRGTYLALHLGVPHLKRAGGGAVVITASVNGTRMFSNTGATAYSATKAGQVAMAKMLAVELAKHKIRVNVICPGKIGTEIDDNTEKRGIEREKVPVDYPEGPIPLTGSEGGTSEEVADLVMFLVSDRSRHITGTPVWIDGAQSLLMG